MRLAEPDVALTDLLLAAEAGLFAALTLRAARGGPRPWMALFFGSIGLAALLGAVVHGVFGSAATPAARALWGLTLLALGLTAVAGWGLGAALALSPSAARRLQRVAVLGGLAYAAVVLLVSASFTVAVAGYLPATLFLLAVFLARWRRRAPGAGVAVLGLLTLLAGSWVQQAGLALHPVYFTHNALYHAIEAVALALLFAGFRAAARAGREVTR